MLRSVALYVVLVGVPLGGLLAILHVGGSIEPPPAVGGKWSVTEDPLASCSAWPRGTGLAIEQSGRFLRVRIAGGEPHRARMDAGRLRSRLPIETGACAGHLATIDASLDPETNALVGTVDIHGCGACSQAELVVRRDP
jgi:hypothetical protein